MVVSAISLDSVPVKAQPRSNSRHQRKRSGFQPGGSSCRRLKKAIRKIRNRRRTKTGLSRMYRRTRRRKAKASRAAVRSRKRPDARRLGCVVKAREDADRNTTVVPYCDTEGGASFNCTLATDSKKRYLCENLL